MHEGINSKVHSNTKKETAMFQKLARKFALDFILLGGITFATIVFGRSNVWLTVWVAIMGIILTIDLLNLHKISATTIHIDGILTSSKKPEEDEYKIEAKGLRNEFPEIKMLDRERERKRLSLTAKISILVSILVIALSGITYISSRTYSSDDQNNLWLGIIASIAVGMVFFTLDCVRDLINEEKERSYIEEILSLKADLRREQRKNETKAKKKQK